MTTPTAHDIDILARTALGEARSEGLRAMQAVCWVVLNRAHIAATTGRKQFGNGSISSACLASHVDENGVTVWQFDCWAGGDPNRPYIEIATLDDPVFRQAYLAALSVADCEVPDMTHGCTGYWDTSISTPSWAEGKPYISIGRMRFVKDI